MQEALLFVLIFGAVVMGFVLGVFQGQSFAPHWWRRFLPAKTRRRYFTELSQLLSGEPDAGIDTFTRFFRVTPETIDIHFAVGDLLRKRGEVDKATQVHHNIVSAVGLSDDHQQRAKLALATDYLAAGLLDRAEILLKPLAFEADPALRADKTIRVKSLEGLASLYEQEQEWRSAIEAIDALCHLLPLPARAHWLHLQAHIYCELAEAESDLEDRHVLLRQALTAEPFHNRANLQMIKQIKKSNLQVSVLAHLLRVDDSCGALTEYLPVVMLATTVGERMEVLSLVAEEQTRHPTLAKAFLLADEVHKEQGESNALAYLESQLQYSTHLARLLTTVRALGVERPSYKTLKSCLASAYPQMYTCPQCGFQSLHFYWRCPTCKTWH